MSVTSLVEMEGKAVTESSAVRERPGGLAAISKKRRRPLPLSKLRLEKVQGCGALSRFADWFAQGPSQTRTCSQEWARTALSTDHLIASGARTLR